MASVIATASQVHVLHYDCHNLQWGEAKSCRVQIVEKSGEYILKIDPADGGKKAEYKLSKEDIEVHFYEGAGFIQVFSDPTKELYGIKFDKNVEGNEFYSQIVSNLGIAQSCLKEFATGTDGHPIPELEYIHRVLSPVPASADSKLIVASSHHRSYRATVSKRLPVSPLPSQHFYPLLDVQVQSAQIEHAPVHHEQPQSHVQKPLAASHGPYGSSRRSLETSQGFGNHGSVHPHSIYLSEAERNVSISFLGHCILECDSHGLKYTNKEHDITIRIPEGAVADGETLHIEFAVAMYGPFRFPDNTRPISPILWLCLMEKNTKLKTPFQIALPHCLDDLTKEKAKDYQVAFVKVHHDFYTTESGQPIYTFQPLPTEDAPLFFTIGERHYGLLKTSHFCYLCMTAEYNNPVLEKDIDYCLTRIQVPITDVRHKAIFCLSYHLPTCIEAIEQQFPDRKLKASPPFKLVESPGSVQLCVEDSKCTVAMEPIMPVLEAADVDFSTHSIKQLELMHRQETYPPRIAVIFDTALALQQILTIRVRVEGTNRDRQLSADLLLPFVDNSSSLSQMPVTYVPQSQKAQDKMEEKPTPQDLELLKYTKKCKQQKARLKIIKRASHKWRDIAALICKDTNKIYKLEQTYHTDPVECLRQVFREDFIDKKPARYPQSWSGIIDLLIDVDQDELAEEVEHVIKNFADVVIT